MGSLALQAGGTVAGAALLGWEEGSLLPTLHGLGLQ